MISFMSQIIAGLQPSEALIASEYHTDDMTPRAIASHAQQLLANPLITQAVAAAQRQLLRGAVMTRAEFVANLENVLSVSLDDFADIEIVTLLNGQRQARLTFRPTAEIDPEKLSAITELGTDAHGKFKIKLEPKAPARQLLAKIHGWEAAPKTPVGQDGKDAVVVVEIVRRVVD